jgi:hypothetical protein
MPEHVGLGSVEDALLEGDAARILLKKSPGQFCARWPVKQQRRSGVVPLYPPMLYCSLQAGESQNIHGCFFWRKVLN